MDTMLDLTNKKEVSDNVLESISSSIDQKKLSAAMEAIKLAEAFPVQGGDFITVKENTWYASTCKCCM
jgi:hypothetical protein